MQLYCLSYAVPDADETWLCQGVRAAATGFPSLSDGVAWSAASVSANVVVAGLGHRTDLAGARSYRSQDDAVLVAFDGVPVHRSGAWRAHDAETLMSHWADATVALEGQFTAFRVDLRRDEVTLVTDSFGVSPLYYTSHNGGYLIANSVEILRILTARAVPSSLGVSSFLTMGWAAGDTTMLKGIRALSGGTEYRVSRTGLVERRYFSPATLAARVRSRRRVSTDEVVTELLGLVSAAASTEIPIKCPLTAGRDSRLMLALLLAAGAEGVQCYTGGRDGDVDVEGARAVAAAAGLGHELNPIDAIDDVDWVTLAKMFVSQTDGLSSFIQIGDYNNQLGAPAPVGLKTLGLGGELGRCGVRTIPYAANCAPFYLSTSVQRRLVMERTRSYAQLWTAEAIPEVSAWVGDYFRQRRAEGWRARELSEVHYAFDRVARWGSTSSRRTASTDDLFTPYCSRAFAEYCFALTPEERYVEAPHYRILSAISPRLRDLPFEKPWRSQDPRGVPVRVWYDLATKALKRVQRRRETAQHHGGIRPRHSTTWFEAHARGHMELCLSVPDSPLWAWIDRSAVERAFRSEPGARADMIEGLLRVATLFWYFHGREAAS